MIYKEALGRYDRPSWASRLVWCLLLDGAASTYGPVQTHQFVNDLVPGANELACVGYERQLVSLSTPTWNSDTWQYLAGTVTFAALGTGADQAGDVVFVEQVGPLPNDSADLLIRHVARSPVTLDGTDFTVPIDPAGLLTVTEV